MIPLKPLLNPNLHSFDDFDPTRLALTHLRNDQNQPMLPIPCFPGLRLCSFSLINSFLISFPIAHLFVFLFYFFNV